MFNPDDYKKAYEHAYWQLRYALECADDNLESPHPLWSYLNELIEVLDRMEKMLQIPNPTSHFKASRHV